jgi:aminoglycoside-2''-adenylyltransferase
VASNSLGDWRPMPLAEANALFADLPVAWWISGGLALELHVGTSWRSHDDLDVSLRRTEVGALLSLLPEWELHVAADGRLRRWDGAPLLASRHENNLWCRPGPGEPWAVDVTISDGDDDEWIFRRDPWVRAPWSDAVLAASDGTRYLAPELQLLYKSFHFRPKDDEDAARVIPVLDVDRRRRLGELLPAAHPWQERLRLAEP